MHSHSLARANVQKADLSPFAPLCRSCRSHARHTFCRSLLQRQSTANAPIVNIAMHGQVLTPGRVAQAVNGSARASLKSKVLEQT